VLIWQPAAHVDTAASLIALQGEGGQSQGAGARCANSKGGDVCNRLADDGGVPVSSHDTNRVASVDGRYSSKVVPPSLQQVSGAAAVVYKVRTEARSAVTGTSVEGQVTLPITQHLPTATREPGWGSVQ